MKQTSLWRTSASHRRCRQVPFPECRAKYQWFARRLLEGKVLRRWKSTTLRKALAMQPSALTREIAHPKSLPLIRAIADRHVASIRQLGALWDKEPHALRAEVGQLLLPAVRDEVLGKWSALTESLEA